MADGAAHLADAVSPKRPIRQWVLSVPYPLRFLFATKPVVMSKSLPRPDLVLFGNRGTVYLFK